MALIGAALANETIYQNKIESAQAPKISIVSPFLNDDPSGFILSLINDPLAAEVELILVDDGSQNFELIQKLKQIIDTWPGTASLISFGKNQGRAKARNRGIAAANGEYILFIDADMVPTNENYLQHYFDILGRRAAAIIFGGFTTKGADINHDTILHHSLSERGDCRPLNERKIRGAYAVASNNLLVRRELMLCCGFDNDFSGWGWEDTEWALRAVALGYGLVHTENLATHLGLDTSATMLGKYRAAAANLKILVSKHPDAERFASVRIARLIGKVPVHRLFRPIAEFVVMDKVKIFPVLLRHLAIKYWRASWAADALAS